MNHQQRIAKKPQTATGIFATLRAFLQTNGISASKISSAQATSMPSGAGGALILNRVQPQSTAGKLTTCVKPRAGGVAVISITLLGLLFSATPALAAPPEMPATKPATAVIATRATLHGELDPGTEEFSEPGEYEFLYNKAPATECTGGQTAPVPAGSALGEPKELVSVTLTDLRPDTEYTFCLLARNVAEDTTLGPASTFTTAAQAAPKIEDEHVTEVTSDSAVLMAKINPEGADTSYRFEYGTGAGYAPVPGGEGSIGEGIASVPVSIQLQGLSPITRYQYRVVASNALGDAPVIDHAFTTQSAGSEFALPDGREWELVSPPNKHGAGIEPIAKGGGPIQTSEGGGALTYIANGPPVALPPGNRGPEFAQILSTRGPDGWTSQDITPPNSAVAQLIGGHASEYDLFSENLSVGLVEPEGEAPLPPLPPGAEKTIYLRENAECTPTSAEAIPATCYLPLVTAANVPLGKHFGEVDRNNVVEFVGASPDLTHVAVRSKEALTPNIAQTNEVESLYEWVGGELQLVSLLPSNEDGEEKPAAESAEEAFLGYRDEIVRNAVSSDGSRIVWEAGEHLYMRDVSRGETVQLDVPQAEAEDQLTSPAPVFQGASSDGSMIFFTDQQRLTKNSHAEGGMPDLYACEIVEEKGKLACKLEDLTKDDNPTEPEESANVQGAVLGFSDDGSWVYFVANGVLGDAAAHGAGPGDCELNHGVTGEGTCYLYAWHDGAARLLAALSGEDAADWAARSTTDLGRLTARVSPNGRYLAFMSNRPLTGYDNLDEKSGVPDEEVYLFDSETGRTVCASCDPTGAQPEGVFDSETAPLLIDHAEALTGSWLAASLPGWTEVRLGVALHQSRYLSNEGRLLFDSVDSLVPADVNHKEDVYEYEPEGERCSSSTQSASEVFEREEGGTAGCVALISSGASSEESAFLEASAKGPDGEEGEDVFFLTASPLAAQDTDSAFDVYDAHMCSGVSPCLASAGIASPPCSDANSCRTAALPAPTIFGAPTSATVTGAGNVTPAATPTAKSAKCRKGFVKKRDKCVKNKRKKANKRAKKASRDPRGKQ